MLSATHVVGARPNFVKAAPVIDGLADLGVEQRLLHTGQHYDERMSDIFFRELGLPRPDRDLGVGSGSHAQQTAALLTGLEEAFTADPSDVVVLYGDVNSTLAGALVCSKLGVPFVHVEAGLRSGDRTMPEEVNRIVTDALADLCLTTSVDANGHLAREGVALERIRFVGNTMIDTLVANLDRFDPGQAATLGIDEPYVVATVHRPANVDDPEVVARLVEALHAVAAERTIVLPLHPRGRERLTDAGLGQGGDVRIIEPLGYVDFLGLVRGASLVITDSGGVQEETTVLAVPCLTVRPNTERPVTITHGTNRLVTWEELGAGARAIFGGEAVGAPDRPPLWDGKAGPRAAREIVAHFGS